MGFAVFMLLVLVLIALQPDNTLFIGESCMLILYPEIVLCVFATYWGCRGIIKKIKSRR